MSFRTDLLKRASERRSRIVLAHGDPPFPRLIVEGQRKRGARIVAEHRRVDAMSLEQALNDVGLDLRRRTEDDDQIAQGRTRSLLFVNDAAAHDRVDGDSVQDFP